MSLRSKVRTGRYALALVSIGAGQWAFAATDGGGVQHKFGSRFDSVADGQREAQRKFGRLATVEAAVLPVAVPDLSTLTVAALRERAKAAGVKGYSKLSKAGLVQSLTPMSKAA